MMKMKKILLNVAFILAATLLGGCDDFFNPDTDVTPVSYTHLTLPTSDLV